MIRFHTVALSLPILCFATAAAAQESFTIAPKFPPGYVRYLEFSQLVEQTNKGWNDGEDQFTKSQRTQCVQETVAPTKLATAFRLRLVVDRWLYTSENLRSHATYDSDIHTGGEEKNPAAQVFGTVMGKAFVLDFDLRFTLKRIVGMDEIYNLAQETVGGDPIFMVLQDEFTEGGPRLNWADGRFVVYPDRPVKLGDSWKKRVIQSMVYLGEIRRDYECRLEEVVQENGRSVARISYKATLSPDIRTENRPRFSGMALMLKTGRLEGLAKIDLASGDLLLAEDRLSMSIEGLGRNPGPNDAATVTMDSHITQTFRTMSPAQREAQRLAAKPPQ